MGPLMSIMVLGSMGETASKGNGALPLDLSQEEQAAQPWWLALGARDRGQLPGGRRGSSTQRGGGWKDGVLVPVLSCQTPFH